MGDDGDDSWTLGGIRKPGGGGGTEEPEDSSGVHSLPLTRAHCKLLAQDKLLSLVADKKNVI